VDVLFLTHRDDRENLLENQMKPLPKPVGFLISRMTWLREGGNKRKVALAVNVIVGVEDQPVAGEIAPVKLQRLCAQFALLSQVASHALDPFSAALN
jgi:hypothetical protein